LIWAIKYDAKALRDLRRLDSVTQRRVVHFMDRRVALLDDPTQLGEALVGKLRSLWRYRVGDYRVICRIQRDVVTVLVVTVGHRSRIYER
jgi:mRNA interferase RelE/StbE